MIKRRYQLNETQPSEDAQREADDQRQRLEKEILSTYECQECGSVQTPFLDYFALDIPVTCPRCGRCGPLSDFLPQNG